MSTPRERFWDNITGIVSVLVLGAGFVALFADFDYFFLIWILGFVVLVPIVAMLFEEDEGDDDFSRGFWHDIEEFRYDIEELRRDVGLSNHTRTRRREPERTRTQRGKRENAEQTPSTQDALSTLRERYANGDLTDEQFERKLDRLLKTETPENATEWRERTMREVETEGPE
jgi:hypothetical protein